ncbi:MFS transporter [Paractinoplanes ferrugineus]|nr:MFS transporter [Actinoplanes ferrugineus]
MTVLTRPAPAERADSARHGVAFWLIAAVFLVSLAFSTVPAPLYPLYQRQDGFSSFTVTIVFAVYAIGVVISLLLAGHVSDWAGRRRVLLPALGLEIVAALLFLFWPALPGLIVARFLTGLGVGLITATATAYLLELHTAHRPAAGRARFEIVSAAANLGGLGTGTLVAGFLAQFAPAPLRTPYIVFLILLTLAVAAVAAAPETVRAPAVRPPYRPQRVRVDLVASMTAFTAFAVFGLFTSLAPGFVAGSLHHPSRLLAGAVSFVVFAAGAVAQTAARQRLGTGLVALAAGVVTVAAATQLTSLGLFLAGGALAGGGAGIMFKAAVRVVTSTAAAHQRGETLAGLFLVAYLGLVGPVLGLGVATRYVPATTAMLWFTGFLLALLGTITLLDRLVRR